MVTGVRQSLLLLWTLTEAGGTTGRGQLRFIPYGVPQGRLSRDKKHAMEARGPTNPFPIPSTPKN